MNWRHPARVARFLAKLQPDATSTCVFHTGASNAKDRPWVRIRATDFPGTGSNRAYAHRYSYSVFRGPIPEGFEVNHTCRRKRCVNPYHLELLDKREHGRISNLQKWESPDPLNEY